MVQCNDANERIDIITAIFCGNHKHIASRILAGLRKSFVRDTKNEILFRFIIDDNNEKFVANR